jgi:hypothetical protein
MPNDPLTDLCEAVRALPPMVATRALNALYKAKVVNMNDAVECGRALTMLRVLVQKRDAAARRGSSN